MRIIPISQNNSSPKQKINFTSYVQKSNQILLKKLIPGATSVRGMLNNMIGMDLPYKEYKEYETLVGEKLGKPFSWSSKEDIILTDNEGKDLYNILLKVLATKDDNVKTKEAAEFRDKFTKCIKDAKDISSETYEQWVKEYKGLANRMLKN